MLETSSIEKSTMLGSKIDMASNDNLMPINMFKILFQKKKTIMAVPAKYKIRVILHTYKK